MGTTQRYLFKKIKIVLQNSSLLVHFEPEKEEIVVCDASPYDICAVLSHKDSDVIHYLLLLPASLPNQRKITVISRKKFCH